MMQGFGYVALGIDPELQKILQAAINTAAAPYNKAMTYTREAMARAEASVQMADAANNAAKACKIDEATKLIADSLNAQLAAHAALGQAKSAVNGLTSIAADIRNMIAGGDPTVNAWRAETQAAVKTAEGMIAQTSAARENAVKAAEAKIAACKARTTAPPPSKLPTTPPLTFATEPTGISRANMLIGAGLLAAIATGGYYYGKKRGWFA